MKSLCYCSTAESLKDYRVGITEVWSAKFRWFLLAQSIFFPAQTKAEDTEH